MKTDLIVSCPYCGKETMVSMGMRENMFPDMENLLKYIAPDIKRYSFFGEAQCACGKQVLATLTVSGGNKE
jgi:hypothetical protein